jgi:hypothetical protein
MLFDALLAVQGHDTTLAQLHHRRSHLPEHQEVLDVTAAPADCCRGSGAERSTGRVRDAVA